MARSLMTIAVAAMLLLALVKFTGCSALLAASAAESADVADKAFRCVSDNADMNDPKQGDAFGDANRASGHARDVADFAREMEAKTDGGKYTDAQWADMQGEADAELAAANAAYARTPQYIPGTDTRRQSMPNNPNYWRAYYRRKAAQNRADVIRSLNGKDLKGMVAEADKATDQAVQAAAKVPKCRDVAQKSRPNAFANRDLFGSQGGAVKGGGGGGHPSGGGGGGGGGGPEGP